MNQIYTIEYLLVEDVATINHTSNLQSAIDMMKKQNLTSIIIEKDLKPVGIITERDILKFILDPKNCLSKNVKELMSSPLKTIKKDTDYREAFTIMSEAKIRHLVVVDDNGALEGIVSESDFLFNLNADQLMAIKEVSKVMSPTVITCKKDTLLKDAFEIMLNNKIGSLIVEQNNKPIGVITEKDTIKLINEDEKYLSLPIEKYMSSPVKTLNTNDNVLLAQRLMNEQQIRHLVVVDDNKTIKGLVTRHDLVKNVPEYYIEIIKELLQEHNISPQDVKNKITNQQVLEKTLNALPHNVVIAIDLKGNIQFSSNKTTIMCNLPIVKNNTHISQYDHELFDFFKDNNWQNRLKKENSFQKITKISHLHTKTCYVQTIYSTIQNEKKEIEGYLFVAKDISNQREIEKKIGLANQQYHNLFHKNKAVMLLIDPDNGQILNANEKACEFYGYDESELKQLKISDINTLSDEEIQYQMNRAIREKRDNFYFKHKLKSGEIKDVSVLSGPFEVENKTILCSIINDITTQSKLKEQLEAVYKNAHIGNWELDPNTKEAFWSVEICDIVGLPRGTKGGLEHLSKILDKQNFNNVTNSLFETFKSGVVHDMIYPITTFNNEKKWVHCIGKRELDSLGNPKSVVGTFQDITNEIENKNEIKKLNTLISTLVDSSIDPIFIKDENGKYQMVNEAFSDLLDMKKENIIGLTDKDIFEENTSNIFMRNDKYILENGINSTFEETLHLDDKQLHYITTKGPINLDDNTKGMFGIAKNITQIKEAENKILYEAKLKQKYLDTMQSIMIVLNTKGEVQLLNKAGCEILGYTQDEILGTKWFQTCLPQPEGMDVVYPVFLQMMQGSINDNVEFFENYIRCSDGSQKLISWHNAFLLDENNNIIGTVSSGEDITEQRNTLNKLKESEEKYRSLFDNIQDAVFIHPYENHNFSTFIEFNKKAIEYLGYTREELLTMTPLDLRSPNFKTKNSFDDIQNILEAKNEITFESIHRTKDAKDIYVEVSTKFIEHEGKKALMSIVRDISDRKEQEEMLLFQSRHAAMGEMISMIAHQWRQPMTVITMGVNNMQAEIELEKNDTQSLLSEIYAIEKQAHYLSQTIDDFRNFFLPNKQKELINICDVINNAKSIIEDSLLTHGIELEDTCNCDDKIEIFSSEIMQVIINLIKNSKDSLVLKKVKNPKIIINTKESNNAIIIEVLDNGSGVDEEIKNKIFDPYFSTKLASNGTGLGLYMSKIIIEKHHAGLINILNTKVGAHFEITLPRKGN